MGASSKGITPPAMKIDRHCEADISKLNRLAAAPPNGMAA
jgi:uncharacterized protein involved in high-affinity Fe2+ transport